MGQQANRLPLTHDRRTLPVVALGILVALVPFLLVPSPGDGGPITFAVRLMQAVAVVVGLGVIATAIYSSRAGNFRPAVAAATTVIGFVIVGLVGGFIEMTGGLLIPIWVWFLAAVVVIGVSLAVTYRFGENE